MEKRHSSHSYFYDVFRIITVRTRINSDFVSSIYLVSLFLLRRDATGLREPERMCHSLVINVSWCRAFFVFLFLVVVAVEVWFWLLFSGKKQVKGTTNRQALSLVCCRHTSYDNIPIPISLNRRDTGVGMFEILLLFVLFCCLLYLRTVRVRGVSERDGCAESERLARGFSWCM